MNKPPRSVINLVRDYGINATTRFLRVFGGREELYVPSVIPPDHPISVAFADAEITARFAADKGGTTMFSLPTLRGLTCHLGYKAIVAMSTDGMPAPAIAREMSCTTRWVRYVLAKHRSGETTTPTQLSLLD
ncbi:MAG: hypothetical protein KDI42_11290 [Gammaproteobacteria bacterium]|nr:hypothetical protein [Gammaproteobacteria bacterium]